MIIFLLIGMVAVGGAGYYIKVVRPKQQRGMDDEDDDISDDGEEMVFEDESDSDESADSLAFDGDDTENE